MDETKTAAPAGKGKKAKKAKPAKPKKEKKAKPKKEKKAKPAKPKKEKKAKPKKEKKAKPPKPKKEKKAKPPKPKKEKKAKKGKGSDGEEEEGKGSKKKLLILLIGIVVLLGVAAFLVIKVFKLFPALLPEDGEPTESSEPGELDGEGPDEPVITGEDGEPIIVETPSPEGDEGPEDPESEPTPTPASGAIHTSITNAQVMEFIESLSPSMLGLDGADMKDYEMFVSEDIVPIDGMYCTQVRVYSKDPAAGTNDIEGIYFVSRGNSRHLYRYDEFTETVTEIPLN